MKCSSSFITKVTVFIKFFIKGMFHQTLNNNTHTGRQCEHFVAVVVVVVYIFLSRLLYLAFLANLGLLRMPHPGMGPLISAWDP